MIATQQLVDEHERVKLSLAVLDRIARRAAQGGEPDIGHLDSLLEFFRTFVDKCHHGKEEDILFPAMFASPEIPAKGLIIELLHEHEQGRNLVRGLEAEVDRLRRGDSAALPDFARDAKAYVALLNQHVEKENTVLYPMADRAFAKEALRQMFDEFEEIEETRVGHERHAQFHQLLHTLRDTYLGQ